ncbi:MAG: DDE-type integrase/transposase/recombinase [Candidatus Bathyarchaeia archaeon]|jgi:transposase-like protein
MVQVLSREERGRLIAEKSNQVVRLDERFYRVASQSRDMMYDVIKRLSGGWLCTCPDFTYRQVQCKHVWAVQISFAVRKQVEARVIEPVSFEGCIFCESQKIVKWGVRHNKYGNIQKFSCKSCGKFFTVNLGFEKMKHNPQGITAAMQLYFSGESLRNTARSLRMIGVEVSPRTILRWIDKYTALMEKYLAKIQPQVSNTWRADEMFLKMKGDLKYLYALMDDQTRFWIAQEVASTKYTADVRPLLKLGQVVAGKKPKAFITDGAQNFHDAYMREWWTQNKEMRTEHIRHIRLAGDHNNNKMERMNGELRQREKVMRSLKRPDTPILSGYQIYHNYIRPHEALGGKTPAEKAGIKVEGKNKWRTIIQNAAYLRNQ